MIYPNTVRKSLFRGDLLSGDKGAQRRRKGREGLFEGMAASQGAEQTSLRILDRLYDRYVEGLRGHKMPLKYVIEMMMDRIVASKTYKGKDYTDASPLGVLHPCEEVHGHSAGDGKTAGRAPSDAEGKWRREDLAHMKALLKKGDY